MEMTKGRDAARRLLGADSDLVKAARSTDSALGQNKESFDKGQYQAFRKGGKVAPKKSVVDSIIRKDEKLDKSREKKEMKQDKAQDLKLVKGKSPAVKKEFMKRDAALDAAEVSEYAKGGSVKGKKTDKGTTDWKSEQMSGQENEPKLVTGRAKGGKIKCMAQGGAGKIRHLQATKDGTPINKKR